MRRLSLVLFLFLLGLGVSPVWAQYDEDRTSDQPVALEEEEAMEEEPAPATLAITGASVVALAKSLVTSFGATGAVPDWGQVRTAGGSQRISATDVFVVLLRTAQRWDAEGALPATVPLDLGAVSPPRLDPEDLEVGGTAEKAPREIQTELFLGQTGDVMRFLEEGEMVPTAVWVNGERLSAAEYLSGLAICIDYAHTQGTLEDTLYVAHLTPPQVWIRHTELLMQSDQLADEATSDTEETGAAVPLLAAPTVAPRPVKPALSIFPKTGARVSGVVDLVVNYTGPAGVYVAFEVDGKAKGVTNAPPFGFHWDTAPYAPGKHQLVVRAQTGGGMEIVSQTATYVVAPSKAQKATPPPVPKS